MTRIGQLKRSRSGLIMDKPTGRTLGAWEVIRQRRFDVTEWQDTGIVEGVSERDDFVDEGAIFAVRDYAPRFLHRHARDNEHILEDHNGRITLCDVLDVDFAKSVVLNDEKEVLGA
jgi:hypothetical protein